MKNNSKKIICTLSSAIVLCGSAALPVSAAKEIPGRNPSVDIDRLPKEIPERILIEPNFRPGFEHKYFECYEALSAKQKKTLVLLPDSGSAVLEVEVSGGRYKNDPDYEVRYQWCNVNGPIYGAINAKYYADKTGEYYCYVWEAKKNSNRETYYPYDAVRSDTASVIKGFVMEGPIENSFKKEAVFHEMKRAS
ncbi:MAG: hypothetical protein IKW96_05490 [Ruminococcus sp.]|uniref:hypothetical protein n=1 Tax=Ruminococcus sp. TaxID=41978 RepID=UPI0025E73393|nr:hypothetical protein [Ruminococcus sp.]MBR5682718.1 hypothetical protein [Ruminococcus sp.]